MSPNTITPIMIITLAGSVTGQTLDCNNPVAAWSGAINATMWDMTVSPMGNVLVAGSFSIADFDPSIRPEEHLSNGGTDGYVLNLHPDGALAWVYTVGGIESDSVYGVATDSTGAVFVAGGFQRTVDFDPTDEVDEREASSGEWDSFIVKLGEDRTYYWTHVIRGSRVVRRIAVDPQDNLLLTGRSGHRSMFVSKLGPDASEVWIRSVNAGTGIVDGGDVAADAQGDVYVTGTYLGTIDFDPGDGTDVHTSTGTNVFVTKYYQDGSYAWTRTFIANYTAGHSSGRTNFALDELGNVFITGVFSGTVDFDPTEGVDEHTTLIEGEDYGSNVFITKLHSDGTYGWTRTFGGLGKESGAAVAVDDTGAVFVTGRFRETVDFDPGPGVDVHTSESGENVFVTHLLADGSYGWTRTWGPNGGLTGRFIGLDPFGDLWVAGSFWAYPPYVDFNPGCEVDLVGTFDPGGAETFVAKLTCPELSADYNDDGYVDLRDYARFQACFTDEGPVSCGDGCSRLDLDPDDDVDLDDYAAFRKRLTGP